MSIFLKLALLLLILSGSAQAMPSDKNYRQLEVNCVQCHADPSTNAPLIGDTERWVEVLEQGEEEILKSLYLGKQGMPPLGYCSSCSQQDFINLIKLMAGPSAAEQFDLNNEWLK